MIKTTLTFQDTEKLNQFLSSQQLSNVDASNTSLTGYFEHDQIETAAGEFGATILHVEDGKTASDTSSPEAIEPLL